MNLAELSGKGSIYRHIANAENYLTADEDGYTPPPLPVDLPDFEELKHNSQGFGKAWKKYFYLTEEFTYINHGALGGTLKDSLSFSQAYERYFDSQPVRVIQREIVPLLSHVKRQMADFVGCEPQDMFFAENVTASASTILKSLSFTATDKILTLSLGYGAVGFAVDVVCERSGAQHLKVQIDLPVKDSQQIVDTVKDSLCEGIKLAIFDHIPSSASFISPIQRLVEICKERDILVLIDGAHALGQLELSIPSYGADFYVANCHKWFCNTRGSAFGYVRRELQDTIRPLAVSWGHKKGFAAEFCWSGSLYYSSYISLLSTIKFWEAVVGQAIRDYCNSTIKEAVRLCCDSWKVEPVCPYDMMGMMALIKLPRQLNDDDWSPADGVKRELVEDCLFFEHKVEIPVRNVDGVLYVRISCHIYNQMSDYEKLCSSVLSICEKRDSLINYNSSFPLAKQT